MTSDMVCGLTRIAVHLDQLPGHATLNLTWYRLFDFGLTVFISSGCLPEKTTKLLRADYGNLDHRSNHLYAPLSTSVPILEDSDEVLLFTCAYFGGTWLVIIKERGDVVKPICLSSFHRLLSFERDQGRSHLSTPCLVSSMLQCNHNLYICAEVTHTYSITVELHLLACRVAPTTLPGIYL